MYNRNRPIVAMEIVERRPGGWCTTRREYDSDQWRGMSLWVQQVSGNRGEYKLRPIHDMSEPQLSNSAYWAEQKTNKELSMPYTSVPYVSPKAEAEQDGYDFAQAFSSAVVTSPTSQGAISFLAFHFAKQYSSDVDIVGAYVSGFTRGWAMPQVKQITERASSEQ